MLTNIFVLFHNYLRTGTQYDKLLSRMRHLQLYKRSEPKILLTEIFLSLEHWCPFAFSCIVFRILCEWLTILRGTSVAVYGLFLFVLAYIQSCKLGLIG